MTLRRRSPLRRTGWLRRSGRRAERERACLVEFRTQVLVRAGFACERCGRKDLPLDAHHIIPRSRCKGDEKFDPANGAALCSSKWNRKGCHELVTDRAVPDAAEWIG